MALADRAQPHQDLRFHRTRDGVRLAYATHGSGPPLLLASCWLSHIGFDWQSPVWRHFLDDLGSIATVIRYDERGFGLSDWGIEDFSYAARLADLEELVEHLGLQSFALMGMSGGAPVALGYAARHPERVSRLVLYGAIGAGCFGQTDDDDAEEAFLALTRAGWARPDSLFRRVFTNVYIPDATEEQMVWLDELQRMSTSRENAVASRIARRHIDVRDVLASIDAPTLVLHAREDRAAEFRWGRELSALIPGARLVPLESRNHILLADEPAWPVFLRKVSDFLASTQAQPSSEVRPAISDLGLSSRRPAPVADLGLSSRRPATTDLGLSSRERDVVALAAQGLDNHEIAERLTLSVRTVERHLQNIYLKLGLSGRTARTATVARFLTPT